MTVRELPPPPAQASKPRRKKVSYAEAPKPRDVEELCEQYAAVCESAVHPLEIASALEFDGLNDPAARKRYGVSDVFTLAEEMYRRVPRRPAEPAPAPDPWRVSKLRPALHGLLYGLPTVCFAAADKLLLGHGVQTILVVSLLTSWALSQALAYLGYMRLGQGLPVQAKRVLLAGLGAGLVGVVIAMGVMAVAMTVQIPALLFGLGLGAYMLGATVLLVLGEERLLFLSLAPGVLSAIAFLLLGRPEHLERAAWGALGATPLLAVGLAVACTIKAADLRVRSRSRRLGAKSEPLVTAADLRKAWPSAAFGLVAGGLLVYPVAATMPGHGGTNNGALIASLPLALSMGAAEWMLVWFRRRSQRLLRQTRELRAFAARAQLTLIAAALQYLGANALMTIAVISVAYRSQLVHMDWTLLFQIVGYMAIGCSMFLALLLQGFGFRIFPLAACATALGIEVVFRHYGVFGQVKICAELLLVLAAYAGWVLGGPARHAS
jgi:hypothetical protein